MRVAFDAQLLFEKEKTGIGRNAKSLIDCIAEFPDVECILNCFFVRDRKQAAVLLKEYREKGCYIRQNRFVPARIYNHLERIFPIPYAFVFGKEAGITQFFNYTVPFGVAGKRVAMVHDMAFWVCPDTVEKKTLRWLKRNIRRYCRRADVVVTVSEFSRQEIHQYLGIPLEKIEVVHNGVDHLNYHPGYSQMQIETVKKKYGIEGDYLLYLGTLEPRKNLVILVEAYRLLRECLPDTPKLVLAGKRGWMYEGIFEKVADCGLEKEVLFPGYLSETDVPLLLCGAKVFVFPSLYEGFGIPPLEAMACGTPVVVSDAASLPEVVGDAGLLAPPEDAGKLEKQIERLLVDDILRENCIRAGLSRAREFTWEKSAEKLVGIYRKLDRKQYGQEKRRTKTGQNSRKSI